MPRVVHFEINAEDPQRAVKFYRKVFGWKISKWGGPVDYWLVETGDKEEPGIDGAIMPRMKRGAHVYNTIGVPSYEDAVKKIEKNGGKMITPKNAVPGVGWVGYFKDTEGNVLSIIEPDESAR
ncbi:MAG: VOC family protein [Euryarchaeota archaeon]|nr:VOC family protein [Euryarchaeota archaeon]